MEDQKLRQLFKNRSNCYVDADDVVQGMDEDCFVETVKEVLHLHDIRGSVHLTENQIAELAEIGSQHLYLGAMDESRISYRGIMEILKRYEELRKTDR